MGIYQAHLQLPVRSKYWKQDPREKLLRLLPRRSQQCNLQIRCNARERRHLWRRSNRKPEESLSKDWVSVANSYRDRDLERQQSVSNYNTNPVDQDGRHDTDSHSVGCDLLSVL